MHTYTALVMASIGSESTFIVRDQVQAEKLNAAISLLLDSFGRATF